MIHPLYLTYRSPFARKVRVALLEKKISFEEIIVDLAHKSSEFLTANPAGSVPALTIPEGMTITDSTLILHYLEETYPQNSLIPKDKLKKWQAWNWDEVANRLCEVQIQVFFENQEEQKRQKVFDKAAITTKEILYALERSLASKKYILDDYSLADVCMGSILKWISFRLKTDWQKERHALWDWLCRLDERESFQRTVPRV
jgi:glutathione S-transferase